MNVGSESGCALVDADDAAEAEDNAYFRGFFAGVVVGVLMGVGDMFAWRALSALFS